MVIRLAIEQIKRPCPHLDYPLTLERTEEHGANIQKLLQILLIFKKNLRKTIKIDIRKALERVKWFLTYMKWTNELSIFINNSPQTFDIHTVAIAVAIVPF